jgi:TusA-related sulfurtransferase
MELDKIKPDVVHDVVGTFCPVPVAETSKMIKQMQIGQILELIADDPGVVEDIPAWCKATGQEFLACMKKTASFISLSEK